MGEGFAGLCRLCLTGMPTAAFEVCRGGTLALAFSLCKYRPNFQVFLFFLGFDTGDGGCKGLPQLSS